MLNKRPSCDADPEPQVESLADYASEAQPRADDADRLQNLGYKDELKREFSTWEVFAVGFSLMSITPSVSSVMTYLLSAGSVGLTWGWLIACLFIFTVATSMSEMASAMPTAGGLYWWTYVFAPQSWKSYLSFLCGYSDALGMIAGCGSINYGAAQQVLAAVTAHSGYIPSNPVVFAVFVAICVFQALIGLLPTRYIAKAQTVTVIASFTAAFTTLIALPIGMKKQGKTLNSASYVFGDTTNHTKYPYGISYLLAWLGPSWAVSGQDACVHFAEDAANASLSIPIGILGSIGVCSLLGFAILAVVAACMDPSADAMSNLISSSIPIANVIERALNRQWAVGMLSLFAALQIMMGLNALLGTARLVFALARDDAFPLSRYIKITTKRGLPLAAYFLSMALATLISLLVLAGPVAANAIFSMTCSALYLSWCLPIFLYAISKEKMPTPGRFYLGHFWSKVNAWIASIYGALIVFGLSMLPKDIPVTQASDMNYSCVVCGSIWLLASLYWLFDARKWFNGPKRNVEIDETVCEVLEAEEWKKLEQPTPHNK